MSTRYFVSEPASSSGRPTGGSRNRKAQLSPAVAKDGKRRRTDIAFVDDASRPWFGTSQEVQRRRVDEQRTQQLGDNRQIGIGLNARLSAGDVMTARVMTVRPEDSIEFAARLMSESDCGALPVVDASRQLLGIITDRDIMVRLIAKGVSVPHAQVSDCMTDEAFACDVNSSVESCIFAMSWHQVRRIPIVDQDHRVVGILSKGDLERFLCEQCEETRTA
jgi:CBS domain-containing protein